MRAVARVVESHNSEARTNPIREPYLQTLTLVERLHHRLLESIKDELDRHGRRDITPIQALMLYSIGNQEFCIGELRTRGYYLGTNVTYNLKKLVGAGLVDHQPSRVDRRSVRISLTADGLKIHEIVSALCEKHVQAVEHTADVNVDEFANLNKLLHRLERFWIDQTVYRL
jgi:DNA-binding MarR family transcriptional regulator